MGRIGFPLILFLAASALGAQSTTLRGKRVSIDHCPGSQTRGLTPVVPVDAELRLGPVRLPVERKGKRTLVAANDGGRPRLALRTGKPFAWTWRADSGHVRVALRFEKRNDQWVRFPCEAMEYQIEGTTIRLWDVNCDGRFGDPEQDGFSIDNSSAICPHRPSIPLGDVTVELHDIAHDGATLRAVLHYSTFSKVQTSLLRRINLLRMRHGLSPATLSVEQCRGCTAHAEYLKKNDWTGVTNPHTQNLGPDGASPEGARAAKYSAIVMAPCPDESPIDYFWGTYYHRIHMMGPGLSRMGVNEAGDIFVINCSQASSATFGKGPWPWNDPAIVPGDGARGVKVEAYGEMPREPVPELDGRGFPLMASFRERKPNVTDFKVELFAVTRRGERPVELIAADPGRSPYALGAVPTRMLKRKTRYRAVFSWTLKGDRCERVVRFETK